MPPSLASSRTVENFEPNKITILNHDLGFKQLLPVNTNWESLTDLSENLRASISERVTEANHKTGLKRQLTEQNWE